MAIAVVALQTAPATKLDQVLGRLVPAPGAAAPLIFLNKCTNCSVTAARLLQKFCGIGLHE